MSTVEAIARLLVQRSALPEPQIRRAADESKSKASFLAAVLDLGVPEPDLVAIAADQLGMPGVDLSRTTVNLDVLDAVPRIVAETDVVLPLSNEGGRLHVAVSAGVDEHDVLEELRFITGLEVSAYAALPGPLDQAIAAAYDAKDRGERFWRGHGLQPDSAAEVAVILPPKKAPSPNAPTTDPQQQIPALTFEVGEDDLEDAEVIGTVEVRLGPARILAVDDDPDILRMLDRTLRHEGYEVDLARDGREAEQKLKDGRYDLVLLDAMLPHVHGFEICARLKASARTRNWPVILLSAIYKGWRYQQDARETFGADDFMEKPFHLPELLRRIKARLTDAAAPPPPERAETLYQQGMGQLERGDAVEARKLLEQASRIDTFSPKIQFALGRAMFEQGDVFSAITAYERAVELRPTLFPALRALAKLYETKGFRRKAVEALERALHTAPDVETREQIRVKLLKML